MVKRNGCCGVFVCFECRKSLKTQISGVLIFLGDVRSGVGLFWTGFVVVFGGWSVGVCELFSVMGGFGCFFWCVWFCFLLWGFMCFWWR